MGTCKPEKLSKNDLFDFSLCFRMNLKYIFEFFICLLKGENMKTGNIFVLIEIRS